MVPFRRSSRNVAAVVSYYEPPLNSFDYELESDDSSNAAAVHIYEPPQEGAIASGLLQASLEQIDSEASSIEASVSDNEDWDDYVDGSVDSESFPGHTIGEDESHNTEEDGDSTFNQSQTHNGEGAPLPDLALVQYPNDEAGSIGDSTDSETLQARAAELVRSMPAHARYRYMILCPHCSVPIGHGSLQAHLQRHHPDSQFLVAPDKAKPLIGDTVQCPFCSFRSEVTRHLRGHIDRIHRDKDYPFRRKRRAKKDLPAFRYLLDQRGQPMTSKSMDGRNPGTAARGQGQASMGAEESTKPFVCPHCDKGFVQNGSMRLHVRTHHKGHPIPSRLPRSHRYGEIPLGTKVEIACPECNYPSRSMGGYKDHINTHHPDSPFSSTRPQNSVEYDRQCPVCKKVLAQKSATKVHFDIYHKDSGVQLASVKQWWFSVTEVRNGVHYLTPALEKSPFTVKIVQDRKSHGSALSNPVQPEVQQAGPSNERSSSPLRLRGGAGPNACPLCSDPIPSKHLNAHFRPKHVGKTLTLDMLRSIDSVMCECGTIVRTRGFGNHAKRACAHARVSLGPMVISETILQLQPRANRPYALAPRQVSEQDRSPPQAPTQESPNEASVESPRETDEVRQQTAQSPSETVESFGYDRWEELIMYNTTYKLLPKGIVKPFLGISSYVAGLRGNGMARAVRLFLLIPKFSLAPGLAARDASGYLSNHLHNLVPEAHFEDVPSWSPVKKAIRQLEQGKFGAAMRALEEDSSIAELSPEVIQTLKEKHPVYEGTRRTDRYAKPPALPDTPDAEEIKSALASYPSDTAPGLSGWTVRLLGLAMRNTEVVDFVVEMAHRMQRGTFTVWELLCTSRLTPLKKATGGLRPIAVGELLYRLCGKALVRKLFRPHMIAPFQYGVGSKGGVEPIVHLLTAVLRNEFPHNFTHLLLIDGSNAYNVADHDRMRQAILRYAQEFLDIFDGAYARVTKLVLRGDDGPIVIDQSQGVRQGCPYSALFYTIATRDDLTAAADALGPEHLLISYVDDQAILSPHGQALPVLEDTLRRRNSSIVINPDKCRLVPLDEIRRTGIEIFGTWVGPTDAQAAFLDRKLAEFNQSSQRLLQLPSQHALLLFRKCLLPRLRHLLRTLDPEGLEESWRAVDKSVQSFVNALMWSDARLGENADEINHLLLSLPIKMGGLGLPSFADASQHAWRASVSLSQTALSGIVGAITAPEKPLSQRELCLTMFKEQQSRLMVLLDDRERGIVLEWMSEIGRAFTDGVPSGGFFRIDDDDFAALLRFHALLPPSAESCQLCGLVNLDAHHAESCDDTQRYRTARHEGVKNALKRALERIPGSTVLVEPLIMRREPGVTKYNDVRFKGDPTCGLNPFEVDVKVTGIGTAQWDVPLRNALTAPTPLAKAKAQAAFSLNALAQATIAEQPASLAPGSTFHPFVLSGGGLAEASTNNLLKKFKKHFPPGSYRQMILDMSFGLAQKRAEALRAVEGSGRR